MTAAVESLHLNHPGDFAIDVRTPVPAIWEHNPRITKISDDEGEVYRLQYDSISRSNQEHRPFLAGYNDNLAKQLGIDNPLRTNRPHLYLSDDEKKWIDQIAQHHTNGQRTPFWLINAGLKQDFTTKSWPVENYQAVVDATAGEVQWVQIGSDDPKHNHPLLDGVIDVRGQTDARQIIRLAYHAQGGLGSVTYLQHLMAAWQHPYVCLVGGREPATWVSYPKQATIHTIGTLDCCRDAACWKSNIEPSPTSHDPNHSLCQFPVKGRHRTSPKCMAMIQPAYVAETVRMFNDSRTARV